MSSISDQVRDAVNPQQALLVVAGALDQILDRLAELADRPNPKADDGWGDWTTTSSDFMADVAAEVSETTGREVRAFDVELDGSDVVTVVLAPISEKKQKRRRTFAKEVLRLADEIRDMEPNEVADVYGKGGPLWLYHGNRDLFMSFSPEVRQAMCLDIEEDDPVTAGEVARDVLKSEALNKEFVMEAVNGSIPDGD